MSNDGKVSEIMDMIFTELGIGATIKIAIKRFLSSSKNKSKLPTIYKKIEEIVNR